MNFNIDLKNIDLKNISLQDIQAKLKKVEKLVLQKNLASNQKEKYNKKS